MPPSHQARTGEKARPYPISMYPSTVELLRQIGQQTGESQGAIVRRLADREAKRLSRHGVPTCEVLTFPSYTAISEPIETTVIFRREGSDDETIRAVGDRLKPSPPEDSFVWIRRQTTNGGDLRGRLVDVELTEIDGRPQMTLTVDALETPTSTDHGKPYRDWIEDVFREIGHALGLRVPPSGSDRSIGPYRVAHTGPLSTAGDVGWTILAPGRIGRRITPVPWHLTPAKKVADQIIGVISNLGGYAPMNIDDFVAAITAEIGQLGGDRLTEPPVKDAAGIHFKFAEVEGLLQPVGSRAARATVWQGPHGPTIRPGDHPDQMDELSARAIAQFFLTAARHSS